MLSCGLCVCVCVCVYMCVNVYVSVYFTNDGIYHSPVCSVCFVKNVHFSCQLLPDFSNKARIWAVDEMLQVVSNFVMLIFSS